MKFEIYQTLNSLLAAAGNQGGWRWRLRAGNGEPIASGESYVNRSDCLHAIALVQGTNTSTPIQQVAA